MRTRVGVLALMALLSVACGKIKGGHSDAGPEPDASQPDAAPPGPCDPGADPTAEEGYACMMQASCSWLTRCWLPYTLEECMGLDIEIFERGTGVYRHRRVVLDDVQAGRIEYHPEAVADCYSLVTGLACPYLFEHEIADFSVADLCPGVFVGKVAADEQCFTSLECGEGALCQPSGKCTDDQFCCAGTCVLPGGTDSACDSNPCVLGSYCVNGICRAGDASSSCNSTADCDDGFWCNAGTCTAEAESGASCMNFDECSGPEVCVIPPGETSGTCARIDQADAMCDDSCFGFECIQPDAAQLGTCQPFLDEGGDCSGDRDCSLSYECPQATYQCDPRGGVGDPCSADEGNGCRLDLFCTNAITGEGTGTCSERLADGERCADDEFINNDECQSGVCAGVAGAKTCQPYPGCF